MFLAISNSLVMSLQPLTCYDFKFCPNSSKALIGICGREKRQIFQNIPCSPSIMEQPETCLRLPGNLTRWVSSNVLAKQTKSVVFQAQNWSNVGLEIQLVWSFFAKKLLESSLGWFLPVTLLTDHSLWSLDPHKNEPKQFFAFSDSIKKKSHFHMPQRTGQNDF